ncbi:MAG: hypothetical protein GW911_19675 [Armatimonadetes bacterium]|nr:hypothetical protein [Armatimonadota bacterium]NCP31241.1 hypothetical protein [Armatimonadota bacterium]NCQ27296.1 hypothetical protein [Armatimonadota bacterium]NDK14255.1 hypothetical protein [Armatimonadota bacterium]
MEGTPPRWPGADRREPQPAFPANGTPEFGSFEDTLKQRAQSGHSRTVCTL